MSIFQMFLSALVSQMLSSDLKIMACGHLGVLTSFSSNFKQFFLTDLGKAKIGLTNN